MGIVDNFRAMLEGGQDSPLLRFSLGSALLKDGDVAGAIEHLAEALSVLWYRAVYARNPDPGQLRFAHDLLQLRLPDPVRDSTSIRGEKE